MVELFALLKLFVTDKIWIGMMNKIRERCIPGTSEEEIRKIEAGQTDQRVRKIYELLKDEPKVRWKKEYRDVLGLQPAE